MGCLGVTGRESSLSSSLLPHPQGRGKGVMQCVGVMGRESVLPLPSIHKAKVRYDGVHWSDWE